MAEEQSQRTSKDLRKGTFADSVGLCLASGSFGSECLEQSIILYSLQSPSADDPSADSWGIFLAHATALSEAELGIGKDFERELLNRFWAAILVRSYQLVQQVTGDPLDHLPIEAQPHVRAAAAYRMVRQRKVESPDWGTDIQALAQWGQRLLEALDQRSTAASPQRKLPNPRIRNFWPDDAKGDERWPAAIYLGVSRRTWSEDPQIDSQICMLEAMAQHRVGDALLQAATQHANPKIAWTATRLIQAKARGRGPRP
jgi:hypothetical protein